MYRGLVGPSVFVAHGYRRWRMPCRLAFPAALSSGWPRSEARKERGLSARTTCSWAPMASTAVFAPSLRRRFRISPWSNERRDVGPGSPSLLIGWLFAALVCLFSCRTYLFNCSMFNIGFSAELFKDPFKSHVRYCNNAALHHR